MNLYAVRAIYKFEMSRTARTLAQSIVSPVISTSLYFVVFGAAIGSRIPEVGGISYGAFIVPGLVMLSLLTQSVSNASFGIYFPKFSGTIYELLSAPVSYLEIVISYVGAAATKTIALGLRVGRHAQLAVVDDPDRRAGAHDPELGIRPGEHEVGAQVPGVHRDVCPAVGLAQHHRQLRHPGGREGPHE